VTRWVVVALVVLWPLGLLLVPYEHQRFYVALPLLAILGLGALLHGLGPLARRR